MNLVRTWRKVGVHAPGGKWGLTRPEESGGSRARRKVGAYTSGGNRGLTRPEEIAAVGDFREDTRPEESRALATFHEGFNALYPLEN
jgi:hypothetical protein